MVASYPKYTIMTKKYF